MMSEVSSAKLKPHATRDESHSGLISYPSIKILAVASSNRPCDCQDEHVACSGILKSFRASRDSRPCSENIINEQDTLTFNKSRTGDGKSRLDALTPRSRVHPRTMARGVDCPDETPFVQWQTRQSGKRARQ